MKILHSIFRVLLGLLLATPVAGLFGVLPEPTEDMYAPEAWAFISALMTSGYMMPLLAITCAICLVLIVMNRMALAAILLAPFTVNVIAFHWFLDPAPISAASVPAYILLVLNVFFLVYHKKSYEPLWS